MAAVCAPLAATATGQQKAQWPSGHQCLLTIPPAQRQQSYPGLQQNSSQPAAMDWGTREILLQCSRPVFSTGVGGADESHIKGINEQTDDDRGHHGF